MERSTIIAFEKYLNDELNPSEKTAFEKELQANADLANELEEFIIARDTIRQASDQRIKKMLNEIGLEEAGIAGKSRALRWLYVAAGIVVLLGLVGLIFYSIRGPLTAEDLYAVYYKAPEIEKMTERSMSTERSQNFWNAAMIMYTAGDFEGAAITLQKLMKDTSFTPDSKHYLVLGVCYMELGNYSGALPLFQQVSPESNLIFETRWDQALCLIMLGKEAAASSILQTIISTEHHPAREKAKKLARKLKKLRRKSLSS